LRFILHAFICFIRSFKPFKMKLGRFFAYPWPNCLKFNGWVIMVLSPPLAMLVFALYSRRLLRSTRGFCLL
jgi:hypothetical protein